MEFNVGDKVIVRSMANATEPQDHGIIKGQRWSAISTKAWRSPAVSHTTTIVAVHRPSKGPNQIVVTDWRNPHEQITLVGAGTVGGKVTAHSHGGWLRFAWIEGR